VKPRTSAIAQNFPAHTDLLGTLKGMVKILCSENYYALIVQITLSTSFVINENNEQETGAEKIHIFVSPSGT
jgi:hypothetical protein